MFACFDHPLNFIQFFTVSKSNDFPIYENGSIGKKSQQESTLKKIQELRLQNDYKQAKAILDRIPPEIIKVYTQRSTMKKEVDQYNTLE